MKKGLLLLYVSVTVLLLAGCSGLFHSGLSMPDEEVADSSVNAGEASGGAAGVSEEALNGAHVIPEPVTVTLNGEKHDPETPLLRVVDYRGSAGELIEELKGFTGPTLVHLEDSGLSGEDCLRVSRAYPDTRFLWTVQVLGKEYSSTVTELDISGTPLEDTAELEEEIRSFPNLERVIMSDCGISNEDMDALNGRYEDIRFVWTVHFSVYSVRTDETQFCASNVPRLGYEPPPLTSIELEPLKYCTDMIALDLGHMEYKDINFISGMTKLKYLILVQGKFSDISPIANMPELEYLELFNNNRITDITPLLKCTRLKHLNLGYCYFLDWTPLMEMKQLERLWLPHVGLSDQDKLTLQKALPDTQIHCPLEDPMGSTGNGWREDQSYYDMRDIFGMNYLPGGTGMPGYGYVYDADADAEETEKKLDFST